MLTQTTTKVQPELWCYVRIYRDDWSAKMYGRVQINEVARSLADNVANDLNRFFALARQSDAVFVSMPYSEAQELKAIEAEIDARKGSCK